jgi:hypothetical protein
VLREGELGHWRSEAEIWGHRQIILRFGWRRTVHLKFQTLVVMVKVVWEGMLLKIEAFERDKGYVVISEESPFSIQKLEYNLIVIRIALYQQCA